MPTQALAYARSRHFEYQVDGDWEVDGSGDLGRITRQQDFIKRSLRRASDKGIRNPSTAVGVVNAAASSVRMDDTLDVGTILTLVTEFRDFNPDSLAVPADPDLLRPAGRRRLPVHRLGGRRAAAGAVPRRGPRRRRSPRER